MNINGITYKETILSPTNSEVVIDDRYTLMFAANHTSLMENIDGDQVVADTLVVDGMSKKEQLKHAIDVVEFFYCCEID